MRETKIQWLADARGRLGRLHSEIEAVARRAAWSEELENGHVTAFIAAVCEAHKIEGQIIKHFCELRRQHIRASSIELEQVLEAVQRLVTNNGNGLYHRN
jgi:hypothetical protein